MTRSALALALALPAAAAGAAPAAATGKGPRAGLVRIAYDAPKDAAHGALAARLRDQKVLETLAEVLGTVRLPRPLTLRFAGCDGEGNAWYDPEDRTVTFCYELAAEIEGAADGAGRYGIAREDAAFGPVVFVLLHECGHALFDLLEVPILGREEDAADHVAAYALLRAGPGVARRALAGAAWMYKQGASRSPDESDLADVHALDAQRLYNVLCMAYGSDPASYGGMVEKGYLPKDRAEGCHEEYEQVGFAVRRLIGKSLDPRAVERTRARHGSKWNGPAPDRAGAPPPEAGR